jgi:hypothetical protein
VTDCTTTVTCCEESAASALRARRYSARLVRASRSHGSSVAVPVDMASTGMLAVGSGRGTSLSRTSLARCGLLGEVECVWRMQRVADDNKVVEHALWLLLLDDLGDLRGWHCVRVPSLELACFWVHNPHEVARASSQQRPSRTPRSFRVAARADTPVRMAESSSLAPSPVPPPAPAPAIVRDSTADSPLLGPLLDEWGDVFQEEVLKKWLDRTDCALLARACWKCSEAVASALGLACAKDNVVVPLAPLKIVDFFVSVQLLAWAKANGCPWVARVCTLAAKGGRLEALQWAREHGCPWTEVNVCSSAAESGHLGVLQWARANGALWDMWTCAKAALGGHLEVLRWSREHGCPWDASTCLYAARGGQIEVLQWARANGCRWDRRTCALAAKGGHLNILTAAHGII